MSTEQCSTPKPFLKWAGGKRHLLPELRKHLPKEVGRYFEPFIGAGAVLFDLMPEEAIIGDTNSELINCYTVIRDSVDALIENLATHRNTEDYYYRLRDLDRSPEFERLTAVERASRLIFLNKTCYNGLFRVNAHGQFNVPFGRYKAPRILDEPNLRAISRYLNSADVDIRHSDFEKCVESAQSGDFIYFDPPYDPISRTSSFTGYDLNGFDRDEQRRLRSVYDGLTARGCKVMLSNSATEFIMNLYSQYNIHLVKAIRPINSKADRRGAVTEVIVCNY